jgi:hypothetical protein
MGAVKEFLDIASQSRFQGWPLVGNYGRGHRIKFFGEELVYELETPSGVEPYVSLLRHFGWVVVLGVTADGRVITNIQWKPGINGVEWGLSPGGIGRVPAGTSMATILDKTQKIFLNETGFGGGKWTYLGATNVESGKIRGADENDHGLPAHMYLATDLVRQGAPTPLPNEIMTKLLIDLDEFYAEVLDATGDDGKYLFNEISAQLCAEKAYRRLVRMGLLN